MTDEINAVRDDFPILKKLNRGKPLAYLDNAASSQKPSCVIDAVANYYLKQNSNVHRGVYALAEEAETHYHGARKTIADWLNVSPEEIIFVRGATEALNLVAHSISKKNLHSGDSIILTQMEHHANIVPWQMVADERNLEIKVVSILETVPSIWMNSIPFSPRKPLRFYRYATFQIHSAPLIQWMKLSGKRMRTMSR